MKTPRIDDFDPKAVRTLPDLGMENFPRIEKPVQDTAPSPTPASNAELGEQGPMGQEKNDRSVDQSTSQTTDRTFARNERRVQIRHSFDVFEDQLRDLVTLQLEAVRAGKKKPKLGEMVEEAIDMFLAHKGMKK